MEFKKHSSDTVAELLIYLADHEDFSSLKGLKEFSKSEVKNLFHELANHLKEVSVNEPLLRKETVKNRDLTDNMHKVIAKLSPHEENLLFRSFRIS